MNNYNRSVKVICQTNSTRLNIIKHKSQTTSSLHFSIYDQLKDHKINKRQQRKYPAMDEYHEDLQNLFKAPANRGSISVEGQLLDKENYLNFLNGNNIENDGNNNKNNNECYQPSDKSSNSSGCLDDLAENIHNSNDREQEQSTFYSVYNQCYPFSVHIPNNSDRRRDDNKILDNIDHNKEDIIAEGGADNTAEDDCVEDDKEECNNSEATGSRGTFRLDDFSNDHTISQKKFKRNAKPDKDYKVEEEGEKDISSHLKLLTTPLQSQAALASFVEAQTIATAATHVQPAVSQHLSHQQLVNDVGQQILNNQQIRVQNILDAAGSLCTAKSMGTLCDMAAFSKMDCSSHDNHKEEVQNSPGFLAKKYYHPLYAHGVCRWPGCELPLEDMASFVK